MTDNVAVLTLTEKQPAERQRPFWRDVLRFVWHDRLTLAALLTLFILTAGCFVGPPIVENVFKVEVNRTHVIDRYLPPGPAHVLGTDDLGRDQLIRLLYGGRVSLLIAYVGSALSIAIGLTTGMLAGYYGGVIDDVVIWVVNTLSSIPTIFLLLIASALWTPSAEVLIVLLALLSWVGTCRLVRGQVIGLKERDYILAGRSIGAPNWWLMAYHILPNVLPIVITDLAISAGALILSESALSFLGLGVQPPTPTWGNMLTESRTYFAKAAYLVFWPGTLITITVLCFYLVGDGLRDALDPRMSRR